MEMEEERMCVCGDGEDLHVDGVDQCMTEDCGCKEFEDNSEEE